MVVNQHPGYATIRRLSNGETVEIESTGIFVKEAPGELKPGDYYVGARNFVNLLTVDYFDLGCVMPVEKTAYAFNLSECVKVEIVDC
jgi:hypothetical protein